MVFGQLRVWRSDPPNGWQLQYRPQPLDPDGPVFVVRLDHGEAVQCIQDLVRAPLNLPEHAPEKDEVDPQIYDEIDPPLDALKKWRFVA